MNIQKNLNSGWVLLALSVIVWFSLTALSIHRALFLNLGLLAATTLVLSDGSPETAISLLEQAQPASSYPHDLMLGIAYWEAGDKDRALQTWDLVTAGQQMILTSVYFFELDDSIRAAEWLDRAEEAGFCLVDVWYQRGLFAEKAIDWMAALAHYEKAAAFPTTSCDQRGHSDARYRMGLIWQHRLDPSDRDRVKALSLYQQAAAMDDFQSVYFKADNYYQLGQVLFSMGPAYHVEAIAALEQALVLRPNHSWANLVMGRAVYRRDGDFVKARRFLLRALAADRTDHWLFRFHLGELYEAEGHTDEAILYYRQSLAVSPENKRVLNRLTTLKANP